MRENAAAAAVGCRLLSLLVLLTGLVSDAGVAWSQSDGLRFGSVKVDAKLGTQLGFNSNVNASNASEASVAQLNIRPSLNFSTPPVGLTQINAGVGMGWREYLLIPEGQKDQSAPDFGGIFAIKFNPTGAFSFTPSDQLRVASPPNPTPTGGPITAVSNESAVEVGFHPGGMASKARLGFSGVLRGAYAFLQYSNGDGYDFRDKGVSKGRAEIRYNLLPRTAVNLVATVESTAFATDTTVVGGNGIDGDGSGVTITNTGTTPVRVFLGGETLLSAQLEVGAQLGTAFVDYGSVKSTPSAYVANARATYSLSRRNALSLEYLRDFTDTSRYDWVQYDRLGVRYTVTAQLFDASARVASSFRNFGQDQQNPLVSSTTDVVTSAEGAISFKVARGVSTGFRYQFESRSGSAVGGVEATEAGVSDPAEIGAPGDLTQLNEFSRHQAYFTVDLKY